jgi:trk system potassium uptake protein TrkA
MRVLILGCNDLITNLALDLVEDNHEVTVLSDDVHCLEQLFSQPRIKVVLTSQPLMLDYLREGGIGAADAFLAMSDDDHQNVLAAQIAKHMFGVHHVACHLISPQLQSFYGGLDLNVIGRSSGLLQDVRDSIEV